jgi:hormone-sensitive lipase
MQGAALDSVLDDAVSMAHRLKAVQQPVTLDVIVNLPHGFLALVTASNNSDMNLANKVCLDYMKEELHISEIDRSKKN